METHFGIPVVDLDSSDDEIAKNLVSALAEVGFAYIKNQELTQQELDEVFAYSAQFFALSHDTKMKYRVHLVENKPACGFVPPEDEQFYSDKPMDVKEAFDIVKDADPSLWPSEEELPGFRKVVLEFLTKLDALARRLINLIGKGLNLEGLFKELFERGDDMQFRLLDYPKIDSMSGVQPGQERCSEHTDYGGITILFQDDCGGLQVMNRQGTFIDAVPLEGTALINVGDFTAMCTGGRLKSTPHKVLISEKNYYKRRQSLVYFCDPDGEKEIETVATPDGEGQPPRLISYNNWRNKRFKETNMIH